MTAIPRLLVILGLLALLYAVIGRFVGGPGVLGWLVKPGGIAAGTMVVGANTLFLLAIAAHLCGGKKSESDSKAEEKKA